MKKDTITKKTFLSEIYSRQIKAAKKRKQAIPTYSRKEFINALSKHKKFNKLFSAWLKSNCNIKLTPSIDRKNDSISYTKDNIQLITWQEHCKLTGQRTKAGINTSFCKKINQYDLNGNYITNFHSILEAARQLNISETCIRRVLKKETQSFKGFIYKYA